MAARSSRCSRRSFGLCVYVAFSVARPQLLYGWAGDMSGLSRVIGLAVLAGWAFKAFGHWSLREARLPVAALCGYFACVLLSAASASHQAVAWESVIEQFKFFLPFLAGITLIRTRAQVNALAWTMVVAQGLVGFEMNLSYLRGFNQAREIRPARRQQHVCRQPRDHGRTRPVPGLLRIAMVAEGAGVHLRRYDDAHRAAHILARRHPLAHRRGHCESVSSCRSGPCYLLALVLAAALAVRFTGPELLERFETSFAAAQ